MMKYKLKSWVTEADVQDLYLYTNENKCIGIIQEVTDISYSDKFTLVHAQGRLVLTIETKYFKEA